MVKLINFWYTTHCYTFCVWEWGQISITTSMPGLSMIDRQRKMRLLKAAEPKRHINQRKARLLKAAEPKRHIKKLLTTMKLQSNTHGCELMIEKTSVNVGNMNVWTNRHLRNNIWMSHSFLISRLQKKQKRNKTEKSRIPVLKMQFINIISNTNK